MPWSPAPPVSTPCADVARLLVDRHQHRAGVAVEAHLAARVADPLHHLARELRIVDPRLGGDLAGDHDVAGLEERLAGHPALGILAQDGVEDGVGDLVRHLVGVTLGDRLRGEQVIVERHGLSWEGPRAPAGRRKVRGHARALSNMADRLPDPPPDGMWRRGGRAVCRVARPGSGRSGGAPPLAQVAGGEPAGRASASSNRGSARCISAWTSCSISSAVVRVRRCSTSARPSAAVAARITRFTSGMEGPFMESSVDAQPEQHERVHRIAGHLAAHRDRDLGRARGVAHLLQHAQHREVQRPVEVGDVPVLAVDADRVLDEVVGPDGEEVALLGQPVGEHGRAGELDHDPHRHVADRRRPPPAAPPGPPRARGAPRAAPPPPRSWGT